ncbi:SETMR methyltransferase, partial [Acromyrmex insinuator]
MERDILTKQRTNIKFLVKLGKNGQEILQMLDMVYGESAMKRRTMYKWVDSRVDDDARAGHPSTSRVDENIQRVHDLVKADRRITTGISNGSVQTILKENLNMWKLCAKIVPKVLPDEQKQRRVDCCNDWIENAQDSNFLKRVITGDESWIYDPETKRQSEEWLLIVFFDIRGFMEVIPITPQMLRTAVKELQKRQLFVKLKNLRDHIQRYYPVETDLEILEQELQEKLKYAVCVGLIAKYGDDQYCIPTLREEANAVKTAISAFWEIYKNNYQLLNKRKKESGIPSLPHQTQNKYINSSKNDETDSSENSDFF